MGKKATTLYVETEGIGETCLEVYSSQFKKEEGVEYIGNLNGTGVVVVNADKAAGFACTVNHMPGCHVKGQETH